MLRDQPTTEQLAAYLGLKREEIAQIVLLLLMEEGARQRLGTLLSSSNQFNVHGQREARPDQYRVN